MSQWHSTLTTSRMWKSWKAYKGKRFDSPLETGKGLREHHMYLSRLGMTPLALRCKVQRLNILHKALTGEIALPVLDHVIVQQWTTRTHQGKHIIPISTSTDIYKYSTWPRTITDWNAIPPEYHTGRVIFLQEDCDGSSNVHPCTCTICF